MSNCRSCGNVDGCVVRKRKRGAKSKGDASSVGARRVGGCGECGAAAVLERLERLQGLSTRRIRLRKIQSVRVLQSRKTAFIQAPNQRRNVGMEVREKLVFDAPLECRDEGRTRIPDASRCLFLV